MTSLWIIINVSCFIFYCSALYFSEKNIKFLCQTWLPDAHILGPFFIPSQAGYDESLQCKNTHMLCTHRAEATLFRCVHKHKENKVVITLVRYTYVYLTQHLVYIYTALTIHTLLYNVCVCVITSYNI